MWAVCDIGLCCDHCQSIADSFVLFLFTLSHRPLTISHITLSHQLMLIVKLSQWHTQSPVDNQCVLLYMYDTQSLVDNYYALHLRCILSHIGKISSLIRLFESVAKSCMQKQPPSSSHKGSRNYLLCPHFWSCMVHDVLCCLVHNYGLAVAYPICRDGPISKWRFQSMY